MSDPRIIDLTDEQAEEIARKFNISVEEVRRQYEATKAMGADAAIADMDGRVSEIEQIVQDVAEDVSARYLGRPDRHRAMGEFYAEGWDAISAEEISATTAGDLFLNMSVAIYMLAEAQDRINALLDGGHRVGS
jgi:hypothetical protein